MQGSPQSTLTTSVSPEKMVLAELRRYAAKWWTEPMPQPEQADMVGLRPRLTRPSDRREAGAMPAREKCV
jgi:hypothetical protein